MDIFLNVFSNVGRHIGFAMGLMVTPDATAHEVEVAVAGTADKIKVNPDHPKPTLSVSEAHDVSSAEGAQVLRPTGSTDPIVISIDFSTLVNVVANPGTPAAYSNNTGGCTTQM